MTGIQEYSNHNHLTTNDLLWITADNNQKFFAWFENNVEELYDLDEENIKDSFKMTILSNLEWFIQYHSPHSFLLFAWIPIAQLNIHEWMVTSKNYPLFWKLLFEAFIEYAEVLKKSWQDINAYIYHFQSIFAPLNLSLFKKDENYIYDSEWCVISINNGNIWDNIMNPNNLFNTLSFYDSVEIIDKFSENQYTRDNIWTSLIQELLLRINHDTDEQSSELFQTLYSNSPKQALKFIWILIHSHDYVWMLDESKIALFCHECSKVQKPFFRILGKTLSLRWEHNDFQLTQALNIKQTEIESLSHKYMIEWTNYQAQKISKDYLAFSSLTWEIKWYSSYTNENISTWDYVQAQLSAFIDNARVWAPLNKLLSKFKSELDFIISLKGEEEVFWSITNIIWEDITHVIHKIYKVSNLSDSEMTLFNQYLSDWEIIGYSWANRVLLTWIQEQIKQIDIYWDLNPQDLKILLNTIHSWEFIWTIKNTLWIDVTEMSLQNQIYLVLFLFEQTNDTFERLKQIIAKIKWKNSKLSFMNTFLACSQDLSLWNKIIDLAEYEWSEEIFHAYAELVNLHSEEWLQNFIRSILQRWQWLLKNALKYCQQNWSLQWFKIDSSYSQNLVSKWLVIKKIFQASKGGGQISVKEFNESDLWFKLKFIQWWSLLKKSDSLSMMMNENYQNPNFNQKHFSSIVQWIEEAHEKHDKDFIKFALKYMWNDFNNTESTFLFLEDDSWDLAGVCKIQQKEDWTFYYWTHYLRKDLRNDFSLWSMLQSICENEISKWAELRGATIANNIETLKRQIEFSWWVGEEIIIYEDSSLSYKSKPFLSFTLNSKQKFLSKNNNLKRIDDFKKLDSNKIAIMEYNDSFPDKGQSLFAEGFKLTRIINEKSTFYLVFEHSNI